MVKYIEIPSRKIGPGGIGNHYDYECPFCGYVLHTKKSCKSHVYKKHLNEAYKGTEKTLKELDELKNRKSQ